MNKANSTPLDVEAWLKLPCDPSEIKKTPDGAEYIPIGIIEEKLDTFDVWTTSNENFEIVRASNFYIATGSVELTVSYIKGKDRLTITRVGACSMVVSSRDSNTDFEGTVLSYCLSNAAKKLGKQFGRHLNGRLDKGETSGLPTIQYQTGKDDKDDKEWEDFKVQLQNFPNKVDALIWLSTTPFKLSIEAKNFIHEHYGNQDITA